MNNHMKAGTFVMNRKTGKAYIIATDTIQTRNRRQLSGLGTRNREVTQVCMSHLYKLSRDEARLCMEAEQIMRGKRKRSVKDKALIREWTELRDRIVG